MAVVQFEPEDNASKVVGLIPVGWFPGAIQYRCRAQDALRGEHQGHRRHQRLQAGRAGETQHQGFLRHRFPGSGPAKPQRLAAHEARLAQHALPEAGGGAPAAAPGPTGPAPCRSGWASRACSSTSSTSSRKTAPTTRFWATCPRATATRTSASSARQYTPNQHKIAREFVLLDNTYCSGVQSADGHQWTDSAIANEYMERQISSGTPRSYPGGKSEDGADALAWASSGFIWDNALAHGKTFRNYGEWMISEAGWTDRKRKDRITWQDFWRESPNRRRPRSGSAAGRRIESLRPHSNTNTVGWDLKVPDVMRAAEFIRELRQFEAQGGFPNLMILFLPNDHTGGTRANIPTPGAQVADNDLALGLVVEAVSHSRFWPETCIFAIEDDPQAGWDHVSGYRTTCFVVSPYTKRRQTISTQYNQTSLIRTIELILGLPPMNHLDATATPMTDCFTDTPDLTPFTSVPNRVPLDQMNPDPEKDRAPGLAPGRPGVQPAAVGRGGSLPGGCLQPHPLARHEGTGHAVPRMGRQAGRGR